MVAHIVPIRRSARDLFAQCIGVLILMPAKTPQAPSVELVHSLFDLTAAEARVARSLTMGQTVPLPSISSRSREQSRLRIENENMPLVL